jgi:hypothetical protein
MQHGVASQRGRVGDALAAPLDKSAIRHEGDGRCLGHGFFLASGVEVTKGEPGEPLDGGEQLQESALPSERSPTLN